MVLVSAKDFNYIFHMQQITQQTSPLLPLCSGDEDTQSDLHDVLLWVRCVIFLLFSITPQNYHPIKTLSWADSFFVLLESGQLQ